MTVKYQKNILNLNYLVKLKNFLVMSNKSVTKKFEISTLVREERGGRYSKFQYIVQGSSKQMCKGSLNF